MSPGAHSAREPAAGRAGSSLLLVSIFVIAGCGLGYELLAGTLSSYLLGNSVTMFSVVIGLFLAAMGLGSYLSRFVGGNLVQAFLAIELAVGVIGGASPLILFFAFAVVGNYTPLLVLVCVLVGALVGLEIPLLVRILRGQSSLKAALGNVLAVDYLGALAASLAFPLVFAPRLGLVRTGALFGALNVVVALVGLHVFRDRVRRRAALQGAAVAALAGLAAVFVTAGGTTRLLEDLLYDDEIIYAESTPYQRLVVTRWRDDVRLFINGNIQFSSADEFRYHEALVHPALGLVAAPRQVLVLGGGDGLAAREILRYPEVERVDLVDLDPAVTRLFSRQPMLVELNEGALSDPRVHIHHDDAYSYLERAEARYDAIVIDLPDPNDAALGKLYTRSFYRMVARRLRPDGIMVTQATSPFYATAAFWSIVRTIEASQLTSEGGALHPLPYHANVPSFGDWGFVVAGLRPLSPERIRLRVATRFLTPALVPSLFEFPKDIGPRPAPVNRLNDPVLLELYRNGYRRYNE